MDALSPSLLFTRVFALTDTRRNALISNDQSAVHGPRFVRSEEQRHAGDVIGRGIRGWGRRRGFHASELRGIRRVRSDLLLFMGVAVFPGAIALQFTPNGANSLASATVIWAIAAFEAQ